MSSIFKIIEKYLNTTGYSINFEFTQEQKEVIEVSFIEELIFGNDKKDL